MEVLSENRIGRRILRRIEGLSIPRFTGSEGERKVQSFIRQAFQGNNYFVTDHDFRSSLFPLEIFPRFGVTLLTFLLILAVLSLSDIPVLSIELSILVILLLILGTRWSSFAEMMYGLKKFGQLDSRNIIAVHPHQGNHLNVIFTAHYDSKSQRFGGVTRFALFGAFGAFAVCASLMITLTAILQLSSLYAFLFVIPLVMIMMAVQANTTGNVSPGAYDNASGVAVMLELAHTFSTELPNANLAFIATGAEEAGLCGAVALMKHPSFFEQFPPERTIIVNLDGIGSKGPLCITDRYGFPPVKTGVLVSNLCKEVANRFAVPVKTNWMVMGAGMDHIPFAAHGYQSVTLSTAGWNRAFRAMHTRKDVVANLDLSTLEFSYAVCQEIVDSIPRMQHEVDSGKGQAQTS